MNALKVFFAVAVGFFLFASTCASFMIAVERPTSIPWMSFQWLAIASSGAGLLAGLAVLVSEALEREAKRYRNGKP